MGVLVDITGIIYVKMYFLTRVDCTRILITCLQRGKIFRRGPCVTGIPITCLQQGKNFRRGPLDFSTRRAYFSHYKIARQPLLLV